jgi:hypothetical protein
MIAVITLIVVLIVAIILMVNYLWKEPLYDKLREEILLDVLNTIEEVQDLNHKHIVYNIAAHKSNKQAYEISKVLEKKWQELSEKINP